MWAHSGAAPHKIVGIADDNNIALCHFLALGIGPLIEEAVKVHVGDQR
jgi:hypothetical protein